MPGSPSFESVNEKLVKVFLNIPSCSVEKSLNKSWLASKSGWYSEPNHLFLSQTLKPNFIEIRLQIVFLEIVLGTVCKYTYLANKTDSDSEIVRGSPKSVAFIPGDLECLYPDVALPKALSVVWQKIKTLFFQPFNQSSSGLHLQRYFSWSHRCLQSAQDNKIIVQGGTNVSSPLSSSSSLDVC